MGGLGHPCNGPRAPGDPRAPRRLPRPRPRAGRRVLASGGGRGVPRRGRAGAAREVRPDVLRRLPTRPGRQQRRGGPHPPRAPGARRPHRPPVDPRPRPAGIPALLHDDRPTRRASPDARRPRPRAALRPGLQLLARPRRAAAHGECPPRVPRARGRHGARVPRRRARGGLPRPRRAGRARDLPPGPLRRVRAGPRRAQHRGRQPQPRLRARPRGSGRPPATFASMPLARPAALRRELERALPERPFAVAFWDGTSLPATNSGGPAFTVRSPAAVAHVLRAPGQLGLGRAYVAGALEVDDLDAVVQMLDTWKPPRIDTRQRPRLAFAAVRAAGATR